MNKTTVVYTVHNNYLIFRASIESFLDYIDLNQISKVLVINDCSSEQKMLDFLTYLNTLQCVEVIDAGEPSDYSFHNNQQALGRPSPEIRGKQSSVGHGIAQNIGIEKTKTEFILFVDSDILFMPKSVNLIKELEACMALNGNILDVGQLVGEVRGKTIIDKPFIIPSEMDGQLIKTRGGWPVHILSLSRVAAWKEHKLTAMCNGGWTNERYVPTLWKAGFKTCNFDIFIDEYAIHLGYATLRHTRNIINRQRIVYCQDGGGYSKSRGSWYGHKFVPHTTGEFLKILENTYMDLEFDIRKNIVTWE